MTEQTARYPRPAPGTPCWASLLVHEPAGSQEFYQALFGWEFHPERRRTGPYVRAVAAGHEVAGIGGLAPGRHLRAAWLPYIACDDADATAGLIRERGGTVAVGPLDAGGTGRMAIAADPTGAGFGIWQTVPPEDAPEADGPVPVPVPVRTRVPGAPVWYELVARDRVVAESFYPAVFGYEPAPDPADGGEGDGGTPGRRLTLRLNGKAVAGVHTVGDALPHDRGPYWKTYFAVGDTDETVRRVTALGGRVLQQPADSPYGRVATAADRDGAQFSVIAADRAG